MNTIVNFLVNFLPGFVLSFAISVFIAGVIKLTVPTSVKAVIFSSAILSFFLAFKINEIMNLLTKILHYQRVSFIALEKKRLEPDNLTPAQDIIIEDLKIEIEQQRAWDDLSGERLMGPLFWVLYIIGVAALTIVILAFWP